MPGQNPIPPPPDHPAASFTVGGIHAEAALARIKELENEALLVLPGNVTFKQLTADKEAIEAATALLRSTVGLNPSDEHGKDTPARFVQMLRELTTPSDIKWKTFPNDGMDEMIVTEGIPFSSLCQHHVIPFIGVAHIGYVPDQLIAGLSKFARVVKYFAASLQVQERLTMQIAEYLDRELKPRGVAVSLRAEHLCMTIRGAQVPGAKTTTTVTKGVFADHSRTAKAEFLSQINGRH